MKKTYIIVIVLIALVVGVVFIFGVGKKAEAPLGEVPVQIDNNQVVCTMDAKLCPDGSYVGRTGPKCEFTTCPSANDTITSAVKEFTVSGTSGGNASGFGSVEVAVSVLTPSVCVASSICMLVGVSSCGMLSPSIDGRIISS